MTTPIQAAADEMLGAWLRRRRTHATGWRRWVFPGLWLIYLTQVIAAVHSRSSGASAVAGYLIVAAFAVCYLACLPVGWTNDRTRFFVLYGATLALTALEIPLAGRFAFVFFVYIGVLTVAGLRRLAPLIIAAMVALTAFTPALVKSWGGHVDGGNAVAVLLVPVAMYGFFSIMQSNVALAAARAEVARLAAENERSRIARDLHDLLGHSLTTVTVKAGLARRLAERGELERAAVEVAEVETIARRTLGEVRSAVAGYREVTLSGELASAHEVLRAAGIEAILPGAVDIVDADASEPFGWAVREAVTNVVRHARATRCTINVGPRWIEIVDDGIGGNTCAGNGLSGLAERVATLGGRVHAAGKLGDGWRVRVELPADPATISP